MILPGIVNELPYGTFAYPFRGRGYFFYGTHAVKLPD